MRMHFLIRFPEYVLAIRLVQNRESQWCIWIVYVSENCWFLCSCSILSLHARRFSMIGLRVELKTVQRCTFIFSRKRMRVVATLRSTVAISAEELPTQWDLIMRDQLPPPHHRLFFVRDLYTVRFLSQAQFRSFSFISSWSTRSVLALSGT